MNERDWNSPEYKAWRAAIKRRDRYRCQFPGCQQTKRLQCHHIRPYSLFPTLRFELSNGVTLCRTHHDRVKGHEEEYTATFMSVVQGKQKGGKDHLMGLLMDRYKKKTDEGDGQVQSDN